MGLNPGWPCNLGRFLPTVQFLMLNETCTPFEGFPAHPTFIRFLPSVNSLVSNQSRALTERCATLTAGIWLLASVDSFVLSQD